MSIFTLIKSVLFKRILYSVVVAALVFSCSTKKNTVVSRAFHNVTARYNGYYYSNVNLDEGIYNVEKANKDNYDKILPIFIYPPADKGKTAAPEFDKAIKKSSLTIQKHAIKDKKGNEIPSAGKWIDNNWINIGIAHFYKREYFSAIEAFEYVARTYNKSEDKFTALLWLIKANNEIGSVSTSETYLSLLKNEKKLPHDVKRELPVVYADYYARRGMYTEAIARLMQATRNTSRIWGLSKSRRARYSFIIGQMAEQQKDNKRAIQYYTRTINLKPSYEMVFYSKIKIARLLDVKRNNSEKTKKDLLKMSREAKNAEYYDVIYYTLGEIEEREKDITQAQFYYKKSVQTSVANPNQKALSFLKLAEINFDLTNYQPAEAYYDSTIATLPPDHPDYENILARKKTLESLVIQIKTIDREDSLQRIAKMSEVERNNFIDALIRDYEKEEERLARELEAAALGTGAGSNTLMPGGQAPTVPGQPATFYFYNPTAVAFGVSDFVKRWGNRKNEDNWRRSNKAMSLDAQNDSPDAPVSDSVLVAKKDSISKEKRSRDYYLKDLPMNDTLLAKSNRRIMRAYYMKGTIYKEELNNPQKTIFAFETLNTRFPGNEFALNTYYSLYRIYLAQKNQPKADYYRDKILNEFPDSEFALLIKNPEYAQERSSEKSEVEKYYADLYSTYKTENYSSSYTKAKDGIKKYGNNEYLPKFEFIRSMSLGKLRGVDTLEHNLKLLVAKYPNSEVTPLSKDVLAAIKKQKNPDTTSTTTPKKLTVDTFAFNQDVVHYVIAIVPDKGKVVESFKTNVVVYNTVFYSNQKIDVNSTLFGKEQIVIIKSFPNAKDAMAYHESLMTDPGVFKGEVKKDEIEVFPISADNLPMLYSSKNVKGYKTWYGDTYGRLNSRN